MMKHTVVIFENIEANKLSAFYSFLDGAGLEQTRSEHGNTPTRFTIWSHVVDYEKYKEYVKDSENIEKEADFESDEIQPIEDVPE